MNVQVIRRDGEPEYAVLPWGEYQALLAAVAAQAQPESVTTDTASAPSLQQLTQLREAKGLTVEALARAVGISPHYLGMIESGEREPDAAIQRALAWNLGIEAWEALS